jgi:hypothetical protein
LHLVDIDPEVTEHDGRLARFLARRRHAAAYFGDSIPELLSAAGLDCTKLSTRNHPVMGRLAFYCATRDANTA